MAAMNTEGMGPFSVGVDNITLEGSKSWFRILAGLHFLSLSLSLSLPPSLPPIVPEAPVNLMHFSQGHDTVLLTWDQPRQTFGDVLQYSINYGRVEIVNEVSTMQC